MSTIKDIKEIPAKLLKNKTLDVYKAYFFDKASEEDHKMKINENVDMFGLTPEAAINELLHSIPTEVFVVQMNKEFEEMAGDFDPDKKWLYESMVVSFDGKANDCDICRVEMKDIVTPILVLHIDMDDMKEKPIIEDTDEYIWHDDILGITVKDKKYEIECAMKQLISFKIMINANGTRKISDIKLETVDEPHKKETE